MKRREVSMELHFGSPDLRSCLNSRSYVVKDCVSLSHRYLQPSFSFTGTICTATQGSEFCYRLLESSVITGFRPGLIQSAPRNVKRMYHALHPTLFRPEGMICKQKTYPKYPKVSGPDKMLCMALVDLGRLLFVTYFTRVAFLAFCPIQYRF